MSCVKIFRDNYSDLDTVASTSVSSEQASFDSDNMFLKYRRSKVWRSNGYFKIESGSNTIVFRESTGVDLTATVVAAEYTSASSLATAIKTALDAAGASTYTVTHDASSLLKFKLDSDGAGGGGLFELRWATSTDMAGILGFDTVNLSGALSYTADVLKINTEEHLLMDMGLPSNPTGFILVGKRNRPIGLSSSATVKLQGNHTNAWGSPAYEKTLTLDENAIFEYTSTGLHTSALRFWRIEFQDQNPQGYIEVGSIFIGRELDQFTRGAAQFPLVRAHVDRSTTVISEGGQTLSDDKPKTEEFSLEWNALTIAEVEALKEHFEFYGTSKPWFISMDTSANFNSTANDGVKLVKFIDAPQDRLVRPNFYAMNMRLREEI